MKLLLKEIQWLKKQTISSPNRQIVSIGSLVMVVFFIAASLLSGIWASLFVNLTAGVAIVVLTVVLVDMLRTVHMNKLYVIPREAAINQIKNANFGLLNSLMIDSKNVEFLREFYVAVTQTPTDDIQALNRMTTKYAKSVSQSTKILDGFSREKIASLGKALSKTADSLEKIRQRYDYSFSDIGFKNDVVELVGKADTALPIFKIAEYDDILNGIIKPIDPSAPRIKGDEGLQAIAGAVLQQLLVIPRHP